MLLSSEEKFVVELLAHPVFNVEFIQKWQRGANNNCKPTVLQSELNGFMAAVRSLAKSDVQHAIYREIDADYKIEDIKLRMRECFSNDNTYRKSLLKFINDKEFISDVYYRWEKSLGYLGVDDSYWETCDDAIKEALQKRGVLFD